MSVSETVAPEVAGRDNPYAGLGFYTEAMSRWFFGRERERKTIIGNLQTSRLTLLHAESGVGKSSLLRAGVAARLEESLSGAAHRGSRRYLPIVFPASPTERRAGEGSLSSSWAHEPTDQLIALVEASAASFLSADRGGHQRYERFDETLAHAADATDATWLVILDQFEEYLLYTSREKSEGRFADELARCVAQQDLRANFLISIREDTYAGLGDVFKGKITNVYGNYLHLQRLDRAAARESILRPIDRFNADHPAGEQMAAEPDLVDAVLRQVRTGRVGIEQGGRGQVDGSNGLGPLVDEIEAPYLQLVMSRLWEHERRNGSNTLRLASLEELGGAETIVRNHLDDALSDLTPAERETAIDLFHYLVTPSGSKIVHAVDDLPEYSGHTASEVNALIKKLERGEHRILHHVGAPPGTADNKPRVEIFHDVLADPILDWRSRQIPVRIEREKLAAQEHARVERRRAQRLRTLACVTAALLALALLAGGFGYYEWRTSVGNEHKAKSVADAQQAERVVGQDPQLATLLAYRALQTSYTPQAEQALRNALPAVQLERTLSPASPMVDAAFSRDGKLLATSQNNGIMRVWSASSHQLLATLGGSSLGLNGFAFSPDGKSIAAAYSDGTVRIWDIADRRQEGAALTASSGNALWNVRFDPTGTKIVTAGIDGYARIFDLKTHAEMGKLSPKPQGWSIYDAEFSPTGDRIVTASQDGTARIWSAVSLREEGKPMGTGAFVMNSARFNLDGTQIVTAGADGVARTWLVAGKQNRPLREFPSATSNLTSAAFRPDGSSIVTGGANGEVDIWSLGGSEATPRLRLKPTGDTASVLAVAVSPHGDQIVSAQADGTARVWSTHDRRLVSELGGVAGGVGFVTSTAFSPDGTSVVTGGFDGTTRLWDASTGKVRVVVATPHGEGVRDVAFSANGRVFATATDTGPIYLWDAASGEFLLALEAPGAREAESVEFSPVDANVVLTTDYGEDGAARIWRVRSSPTSLSASVTKRLRAAAGERFEDAAFSSDGKLVVTAGVVRSGGVARIWSVASGREQGQAIREPPSRTTNGLLSAAFSHDEQFVVTSSEDGTARIWSTRTQRPVGPTVTTPAGSHITDAQFSPDGRTFITASTDGTARLWDARSGELQLSFAGRSGGVTSVSFSADGGRVVTGNRDGTARLWSAIPSGELGRPMYEPGSNDLITASFDSTGSRILTASEGGTARIWDATRHREVGHVREPRGELLTSAEFDPTDSNRFVTASQDGTARIWSTRENRQVGRSLGKVGDPELLGAVFSPDGRHIVTASSYRTAPGAAQLWNVQTHRPEGLPFQDPRGGTIRWTAFGPHGNRIVIADDAGSAYVYDWRTRSLVSAITEPSEQEVNDVWFSPDGRFVVTCSDDGTARVWNVATGAQEAVVTEPGNSAIYNAVIGPHGWLLTSSGDGYARIWDWRTGALLVSFDAGDRVSDSEFSPDGRTVVTASEYGTARIFSTALAGPVTAVEQTARRTLQPQITPEERNRFLGG